MARKLNKEAKEAKEQLLNDWKDVYGVNYDYGFNLPEDDEELNNISIGFNTLSLKKDEEADVLLVFTPEMFCFLVEDFLNNYPTVYLNHIAERVGNEPQETDY